MPDSSELLIATGNKGKFREFADSLCSLRIRLFSLEDFPWVETVEETGSSFAENARIKALAYARETGALTVADDSGLEVKALDGAPGLYSARYGGPGATDAERIARLLKELEEVAAPDRGARFVCAIALAAPSPPQIVFEASGVCVGRIATEPEGRQGFGYDPLFIPEGFESTFGQLPEAVKREISHRAVALRQLLDYFRRELNRR
jgi:XTP/dITP diphosphohydrolase